MITIKKGFTLIELLVVIAIIAILAAILFPVFAQAREKARQASCLSNLKNIGTAVMLYTDDYNQTYPIARYGGMTGAYAYPKCFWTGTLFPYVKDFKVFYCPSWVSTYNPNASDGDQYLLALDGGYAANYNVLGDIDGNCPPKKAARIKSASNVAIYYDAGIYILNEVGILLNGLYNLYLPGAGLAGAAPADGWNPSAEMLSDFNNGRHNEGINITYADGHAGFEKSATVYGWASLTTKNPFKPETW